MLGLGWTEMLLIGVVALIVIGPKDLPVVMHRIGRVVGQIQRMGAEFRHEINKTAGLDEVRNLRNSITEPLRKTSDEIRREFNKMTPTGLQPGGIIKPADPKAESVVNEIRVAAGMESVPSVRPAVSKMPVRAKAALSRPVIATELSVPDDALSPVPVEKPVAKRMAAFRKPTARRVLAANISSKPPLRKRTAMKKSTKLAELRATLADKE